MQVLLKFLTQYLLSPLPPMACSSFRWSTVIWRISAFSSLEEPWASGKKELVLVLKLFFFFIWDCPVSCFEYTIWSIRLSLWHLTCFSKALGTILLSSDRLWLILSLRLFSIICGIQRNQFKHRTTIWSGKHLLTGLFCGRGLVAAFLKSDFWKKY